MNSWTCTGISNRAIPLDTQATPSGRLIVSWSVSIVTVFNVVTNPDFAIIRSNIAVDENTLSSKAVPDFVQDASIVLADNNLVRICEAFKSTTFNVSACISFTKCVFVMSWSILADVAKNLSIKAVPTWMCLEVITSAVSWFANNLAKLPSIADTANAVMSPSTYKS